MKYLGNIKVSLLKERREYRELFSPLSDSEYEDVRELAWDKCVLCTRCYCPIGISIPSLIAAARGVCREKGVHRWYTTERNA